jgi:hypothetical protein
MMLMCEKLNKTKKNQCMIKDVLSLSWNKRKKTI